MTDPITRLNAALEGRYSIEREIGEGGMATVYLAEDLKHERKVALKVLKPELSAVVGADRFLAEIKTTANLQHPHILPLHDSGEADGFLFYVMPYVEGETLRHRIDHEKQLPVDEAVALASKVAGALQHAHEHGVIHRDIKPGNILLQGGEPVVADFGIALAVGVAGGSRLTETGLSVGTPYYMSPEQATGDQAVGPSTDTYALACVLYEILVGEPPYLGNTAQAVLGKIIAGKPVSATEQRSSVPTNVDAALRCALEKLPADRFSSAQDFSRALADSGFRHGEEPAVVVGGRRQWTPLAMVSTGLAVLLVMNLAWTLLRPEPQRLAARFEFVGPDPGATVGNAGSVLDVSSDGSRFVFLGSGPTGGQLWHRPLDQLVSLPIPGTAGARSPRFSPDGESVVFRIGDRLLTVSLTGGAPSTAVSEGVDGTGVTWGSDGMLYFAIDGDLWRVPAAGGEQEQITSRQPDEAPHAWPDVLPNGKGILLTRLIGGLTSREIAVWSFETGEISVLLQGVMARYAASGHIVYASSDGRLLAAPFDADRLEVTGPSQALAENIQMNPVGGSVFALSQTGVLLYRTTDSQTEYSLQVAPFDGAAESIPLPVQNFADPRWSPDGRSLAYSSGPVGEENIYVYDVELGTAARQLTFEGSNVDPVWSQDGSRVAFASVRGGASDYDLFVKTVNEDTFEERILELEGAQFPRQWLTNDMVVFESGFRSVSGLWQVSAAGGDATLYIESESDFDDVAVSPDGRWAVYQSDETGAEELYVRSFPQPRQQVRVSAAGGGGQFPRWSPDGSLIYYWSAEGLAVDTLYAATVLTEPTFTVLSREVVHTGDYAEENWDLHPDGDRIVAAQPSSPTTFRTDHLFVVLNIFEELR